MTLAQLRQQIETVTGLNDSATAFNRAINATYRSLVGSRRWSWLESTANLTLPQGLSQLALPTDVPDLVRIARVVLFDPNAPGEYLPLDYVTPDEATKLRREVYGDHDGVPQVWTAFGTSFSWLPDADRAYTARLTYYKDPADLAADGDTPLLPATHHEVLVWGAARIIARRQMNKEIVGLADQEYERERLNLVRADSLRQQGTSSQVVDSGFFDPLENY